MASYEEALTVLRSAIRDLNDQQVTPQPVAIDESSPLIGAGGVLDSLALVTLLVAVEDAAAGQGWKPLAMLEDTSLYSEGTSLSVGEVAQLIRARTER